VFIGKAVALYDVRSGRLLSRRPVRYASGLKFDRSGTKIAAAGEDGRVTFLDARSLAPTGKQIVQRPDTSGEYAHNDLAWSPDGTRLAIAYTSQGKVAVFDTTTGKLLVKLPEGPRAWTEAFTPDGSLLVTGGGMGIPSFWDTRTWKRVARPAQGHTSVLFGMSVSPDGRTLASADPDDGDLLLWDVASRRQVGTALPGNAGDFKILFYPNSRRLLAISFEGRVTRWDVDPESWKRRACDIAGRNLTRDEWRDFVGNTPYHATCP
jgi:WD40 repeat protein